MMVGLRDRLIRNRTQLSNSIRGYAAEIHAGHSGERGLEISQTRGATQLQPC
jgi:hypothetical protein